MKNNTARGAEDTMASTKKKPEGEAGSVKVTVSLPAELVRRLDELAGEQRRSRSNALALVLEAALDGPRLAG